METATFFNHISVILVRTTHPGNVGAVARAMKNMGFSNLSLVAPDFNPAFSEAEALSRAAGAEDLVKKAKIFQSLDDALAEATIVIGASARSRKLIWPLLNSRECSLKVLELFKKHNTPQSPKVAFLFGQEASGLSNEELQRCHYHINIPAAPEYSSLNLAMAVQVICYELRMTLLLDNDIQTNQDISSILNPEDAGWDEEKASVKEVEGVLSHFQEIMIETGFYDPDKPRQLMTRLRRLFQRTQLDRMEVNILRGILSAIQKQFNR